MTPRASLLRFSSSLGLSIITVALVGSSAAVAATKTRHISVSSAEVPGDSGSYRPSVSDSGRFVAFISDADNLVGGDTNGDGDVFVRDRKKGKTKRVSKSSKGVEADDSSSDVSISSSGRYVAFSSRAKNLVKGDTNLVADIFVRDRTNGKTKRISVRSNGRQATGASSDPSISGNGRFVAFASRADNLAKNDLNGLEDVFVHDRKTGRTSLVSQRSNGKRGIDGFASRPSISANGRYVAFESSQKNLVKKDTNGVIDVFVHDRVTGKTTLVSKHTNGSKGDKASSSTSISGDGRFVAFASFATNLVNGDTNDRTDIFVRDRKKGKTKRVSVRSNGAQAHDGHATGPAISRDGRMVAWEDSADDLGGFAPENVADIYLHDRKTRKTKLISVSTVGVAGDDDSKNAAFSGDRRFVAFESDATNLVPVSTVDDADIYLRG